MGLIPLTMVLSSLSLNYAPKYFKEVGIVLMGSLIAIKFEKKKKKIENQIICNVAISILLLFNFH